MQSLDNTTLINRRRVDLARARGMLAELRDLVDGALEWADDDSAWKLEQELDSIDLVNNELDDIATDPEQEITLTTLSGWLRLARDLYSPKVVEEPTEEEPTDEEDFAAPVLGPGVIILKHDLIIKSGASKNQSLLDSGAQVFQLPPHWTKEQRARARAILTDHVTYANDDELARMLADIGRPMW